jgi:mRNA-degrading endonuclease RelE of RelBE toxin-antitoxin system
MESYEILFQQSVRKDLRKLAPDNVSRILAKIETLASVTFPPQAIQLQGVE